MSSSNSGLIDRNEGIRLCNNNEELAKTFLNKFLDSLPTELVKIQRQLERDSLSELEASIHKLHGACHYCGVPTLRESVRKAEHALKTQNTDTHFLVEQVIAEITRILVWKKGLNVS